MLKTLEKILVIIGAFCVLCFIIVNIFDNKTRTKNDASNVTTESQIANDTVYTFDIDTVFVHDTTFITKRIVDTVYIEKEDESIALPVISKHYRSEDVYDVWISGVEPLRLDSATVYPRTEYKTIVSYKDRLVADNKYRLAFGGGFSLISERFIPHVGISLITPQNAVISLNLANYDNVCMYSLDVKLKIFEK